MTDKKSRGRPVHPDTLTPGEWRVAEGVRHGLTNPEIAARGSISVNAVKFHVSNILSKLDLASREQLRAWNGVAASSSLETDASASGERPLGTIGQIARSVSDLEASIRWYGEVLGLHHQFTVGNMAFFDCGGTRLMLSEGKVNPESILYFRVADIHGTQENLASKGAKILSAPHRIHTHQDGSEEWIAFIEDNDGRPLGLITKISDRKGSKK